VQLDAMRRLAGGPGRSVPCAWRADQAVAYARVAGHFESIASGDGDQGVTPSGFEWHQFRQTFTGVTLHPHISIYGVKVEGCPS